MTKYEVELVSLIQDKFKYEIESGSIKVKVSTPEDALQQDYKYKGWKVAIEKNNTNSRNTRIIINSPDKDTMDEISDYKKTLNAIVDLASDILNDPPAPKLISQGVIELKNHFVEFVPREDF